METQTHRKILIIEDNPGISTALQEVLSDCGHSVEIAVNGKDGLDHLINRDPPDVILLDIFLPVMSGIEFRNRQLQIPYLSVVPVIAMSADMRMKQRSAACRIGHFLKKPFDLGELLEMIEEVTKHKEIKKHFPQHI